MTVSSKNGDEILRRLQEAGVSLASSIVEIAKVVPAHLYFDALELKQEENLLWGQMPEAE
jgi:hypothetical protein